MPLIGKEDGSRSSVPAATFFWDFIRSRTFSTCSHAIPLVAASISRTIPSSWKVAFPVTERRWSSKASVEDDAVSRFPAARRSRSSMATSPAGVGIIKAATFSVPSAEVFPR